MLVQLSNDHRYLRMRLILLSVAVLCAGACEGTGQDRVHEITAYHHQLVYNGTVMAEGYVYQLQLDSRGDFAYMAKGRPYDCNGGNKFVLEEKVSVVALSKNAVRVVGVLGDGSGNLNEALEKKIHNEVRRLRENLPMLFSAAGCSPQGSKSNAL